MAINANPVRMSPVEIVLVTKYFELIFYRRLGPQLTKAFYKYLFTDRPDLREAFPKNMLHQNQKLARSIKMVLEVLPDLDRLDQHFVYLARAHQQLKLGEGDFRLFATCLVKALEELTEDKVIPEARNALTRVCLEVGRRIRGASPPGKRKAA